MGRLIPSASRQSELLGGLWGGAQRSAAAEHPRLSSGPLLATEALDTEVSGSEAKAGADRFRRSPKLANGPPQFDGVGFSGLLRQAVAQAERTDECVALHLVDCGALLGSRVEGNGSRDSLAEIASRLTTLVRRCDALGYLDDGLFALLQRAVPSTTGVTALARKVLAVMPRSLSVAGQVPAHRISVGICVFKPGCDAESMLDHADVALRLAQEAGGETFRFYPGSENDQQARGVVLVEQLDDALRHDEIFVAFQPQVELSSGRIVAFEALLRWRSPNHGVIGPGAIMPTAEASGQITDIGIRVLEKACRRCVEWSGGPLHAATLSVNVSPAQLVDPSLLPRIADVLKRTGLPAHRLELELTETIDIGGSQAAETRLAELNALGVRLAIDDFGTGYASLRYLRTLPVHKVKLPKELIDGIGSDPDGRAIVEMTAALGHRLGLTVVAEGIETPAQLAAVQAAGCDLGQGFLLGKPRTHLPPEATVALPAVLPTVD